jgi:hypothetical protein
MHQALRFGSHLQSFARELDLVALDVFDEEDLELGQVVQGEVAHSVTQDAFLQEGNKLRRGQWRLDGGSTWRRITFAPDFLMACGNDVSEEVMEVGGSDDGRDDLRSL